MTATATGPILNTAASPSVMHVCLLGLPHSGKSALFSALEQEAVAHACSLHGEVADLLAASMESVASKADVVVVAVDAGTLVESADPDFDSLLRVLDRLTEERGRRSAIAGLPVFVVLTKCDLLAHAGVTTQAWLDCIEERKKLIAAKLSGFIGNQTGPPPFGSVDVHVWGTSIERPNLVDLSLPPSEPFGVAELFCQAREHTHRHRISRRRTERLLIWMVAGTLISLLGLLVLATALIAFRPSLNAGSLTADVGIYRLLHESQTASERLRAPLAPTIRRLEKIRDDPTFDKLSQDDRQFVDDRLDELIAYVDYKNRLETVNVSAIDTEADLTKTQERLLSALQPPLTYVDEWVETDAARLRSTLINDLAAFRDGIDRSRGWFDQQLEQARELQTFAARTPNDEMTWKDWGRQVTEALGASFPHAETDSLPGSESLTYSNVLHFEPIAGEKGALDSSKSRLKELHELVSALGMVGQAPDGRRPPLDIPSSFSLEDATDGWRRLETLYPTIATGTGALDVPDSIASQVRQAARKSFGHLLDSGRDVIARRLALRDVSEESLDSWRGLLPWLAKPEDLRDWRRLAVAILRIIDPAAQDPVSELSDFIRRDRFDLDVQYATLEIPLQLNLRPTGPFSIYKGLNEPKATPVFSLQVTDEKSEADRQATSFSLLPAANSTISFTPGEFLFARMPVKKADDARDWVLTWARRRSAAFPFECLRLPPRLHRIDQPNTEGELLDNARLKTTPENGIPKVPDLVPIAGPK